MDQVKRLTSPAHREPGSKVVWALVAGLFLLRVPFLGGMRYFTWTRTSAWVMPIFEVGTYLLTAILIWFERDRLSDSHVDRLALIILVIGKPIELLLSRLRSPLWRPLGSSAYLLYLPVAIGLLVGLRRSHPRLGKAGAKKWLWVAVGVATGVTVGAMSGWLAKMEVGLPSRESLTWRVLAFLPVQQMLYAGIAEEPFFRGFLWGALRRAGWKDVWVWATQAGLFWLAHIYWLGHSPMSFWVIVPVGGLVFGLLAWGSRSIGVSMVAHGLANGILNVMISYRIS